MQVSRKNVFINCPFDEDYRPLLNVMLYTIIYLGYNPIISETTNSAGNRLEDIKNLINESIFSIHDISRCRITKITDLPRFNMPFELGLDIGCITFGNRVQKKKKILILEKEQYYYRKVLSDISGQDIENHGDDRMLIIEKIRNWFTKLSPAKRNDSPMTIWSSFVKFNSEFNKIKRKEKFTTTQIINTSKIEYITAVKEWINKRRAA